MTQKLTKQINNVRAGMHGHWPRMYVCVSLRMHVECGDLQLWCGSRAFITVNEREKQSKLFLVSCFVLAPRACEQSVQPCVPAAGPICRQSKRLDPRPTWCECNDSVRLENTGSARRLVDFLLSHSGTAAHTVLPMRQQMDVASATPMQTIKPWHPL